MKPNKEYLEKCLFFGVKERNNVGHHAYKWTEHGPLGYSVHNRHFDLPMKIIDLDGTFNLGVKQGQAQLINFTGSLGRTSWCILVITDFTGDDRPGSHATFVMPGHNLNFGEALEVARAAFPDIMKRVDAAGPVSL